MKKLRPPLTKGFRNAYDNNYAFELKLCKVLVKIARWIEWGIMALLTIRIKAQYISGV